MRFVLARFYDIISIKVRRYREYEVTMDTKISPKIGDTLFYVREKVVVEKLYPVFHIAKVRCIKDNRTFGVDWDTLTPEPDNTDSIPLWLFSRKKEE